MELVIKWKDRQGEWQNFDSSDIMYQSRNHAISLFSQGTPVIIKQGAQYIVNRPDLFDQYKRQGKPVKLLSECEGSEASLIDVGFIGEVPK